MSLLSAILSTSSVEPRVRTHAREVVGASSLAGAVRLFFRFPTPRILGGKLLLLGAARLLAGPATMAEAATVAVVACGWPLLEWLLHAKILHMRPLRVGKRSWDPIFARYHRYHHEHPWILERTFLPTRVLLVLVPVNVALFAWLMPSAALAITGMASLTAAALLYEWTHYLTHTPYRPRSRYYARIQQHHMRHHFKDERRSFAFTVPGIDGVLGTSDEQADARRY